MANKHITTTQFLTQDAQQAIMQKELQNIKFKLEQASKTLAQKELIIDSLESDLEHMIDQLVRFQQSRNPTTSSQQWISRTVPGLHHEMNAHA